jgi:carboxyl-terminal processing protease
MPDATGVSSLVMEMENHPPQTTTPPARPPANNADPVPHQYVFGAIIALAVMLSFVAGVFIGDLHHGAVGSQPAPAKVGQVLNKNAPPPEGTTDVNFQAFWDIWKTVKARHVGGEPPSDIKMFYGAIEGMVASVGDPYTVFFDPDYAQKFNSELDGEFEGIGAEIGMKNDDLTVIAPLPGTPADKAGIKAGDRILAIDGIDTTGMLVDDAVTRIRGTKGTKVTLTIMRDTFKVPKDIVITRDQITVDSVTWKMEDVSGKKVAHITISEFNDKTTDAFNAAVGNILLQNPVGVILDLRNNPGGYLDAAVSVAGEWIQHGTVVTEKFGDGTSKPYVSDGNARLADMPTVVLINGGSASASEIVAGALQDDKKATLVGEQSFGKGSVQDYTEFADGSALKLTIALWYTPNDHNINKQGITPDVVVKLTPDDFNADRDPQLDRAHDILTGKNVPKVTAASGSGTASAPKKP